jgi:hypothetical protein
MLSNKKLGRLNELLAIELGRNRWGEGLYSWSYSEHLLHKMVKLGVNGQPVYDYRCVCGTNIMVHQPHCKLTVPVVQLIERKLAPLLKNQWVAVVWADPGSPEDWLREFGPRLMYPGPRGYRVPTNACLEPDVDPDIEVTWDLIHKIREQRKKTYRQWIEESEDALALKERRDESLLDSMVSDAITAFGNAKPGARSGGISLPSKETSSTGSEAGRAA